VDEQQDSGFEVRKLEVGDMGNNCYILVDPATTEALIIDAAWEAGTIVDAVQGLKVKRILTTHGHWDHHQALDEVRARLDVPAGIGKGDQDDLSTQPDFEIVDGARFWFGSCWVKAIHTPGHTHGSTCFLGGKHLFTGDTLFPGGPGNTNRDPIRFAAIIESIRVKLLTLPGETIIHPGHGADSTIGAERPHLQEWIDRGW
jgi:glyoxylase-like metal-dependent hydrolase (beta-lactamase superfamily II)